MIAGRAYLRLNSPEEAVFALAPLLEGKPQTDVPRDVIGLELARARIALAKRHEESGETERARGQLRDASAELGQLIRATPNRQRAPMRVARALALSELVRLGEPKRHRKAIDALDEVLAEYPKHPDIGDIALARARVLAASGKTDAAAAALRRVTIERGEEPAAQHAWNELVNLEQERSGGPPAPLTVDERLEQAAIARALRHTEFSLEILEDLLAKEGPGLDERRRRDATFSRAWSRFRARDYDGCVDDMLPLHAETGTKAHREHLGRCFRYAGRYEECARLWERTAAQTKSRGVAADARWRAVVQSVNGGDYQAALDRLGKYERLRGGHDDERRWLKAWLPYRLGRHDEAVLAFERYLDHGGERKQAARYFLGKVMFRSDNPNRKANGAKILREVVADGWKNWEAHGATGGFAAYYGLAARQRLIDGGEEVSEPPRLEPMADAERCLGYAGTRDAFDALADEFEPVSDALRRAHQLHAIGYIEEARREYRVAASEYANGKTRLRGGSPRAPRSEALEVGLSWRADWEYPKPKPNRAGFAKLRDEAAAERWRIGLRELAIGLDEPNWLARLSPRADHTYASRYFLRAYREAVEAAARSRGLDPLHYWALMYTESRFRRFVLSHMNARGIMQVWPPALRRRLIELGQYQGKLDVDALFEVEPNLAASLLWAPEAMRAFHGQRALMYGSYNGGKHNISRWLAAKHDEGHLELDDYIEEIVFHETRKYVRRVLSVHAAYAWMYRGKIPPIDFVLDPIFESGDFQPRAAPKASGEAQAAR